MLARSFGAVIALGAATVVGVGWAPPAGARTDRCAPKHSVTIKANAQVRVYRDRPGLEGARVIGCHRATGSKTRLSSPIADTLHEFGGPQAVAVRGSTIAYAMLVAPQGDEGGREPSSCACACRSQADRPAFAVAPATQPH